MDKMDQVKESECYYEIQREPIKIKVIDYTLGPVCVQIPLEHANRVYTSNMIIYELKKCLYNQLKLKFEAVLSREERASILDSIINLYYVSSVTYSLENFHTIYKLRPRIEHYKIAANLEEYRELMAGEI